MITTKLNALFGDELMDADWPDGDSYLKENPLDIAAEWISKNVPPEDVYNTKQLHEWAIANGYTN